MFQTGAVILGIIALEAYTFFKPIYLPANFQTAITDFGIAFMSWHGFLPVEAIMDVLYWIMYAFFLKLCWKLAIGLIGMIGGGGAPNID